MKIERLLGIVLLLLNRRKMTAPELAEYFEVSVRTIYRDIQSIEMAGIPITSSNGVSGGFEIMDSYCLEKQLFSAEDMLSILNALKAVSLLGDNRLGAATKKVARLLPPNANDALLDELHIELTPWGDAAGIQTRLKMLQTAVAKRQCVRFAYQGSDRTFSEREVEPLTLVFKGSAWYLFAYCRLRSDYRLFRLSRMRNCVPQPDIFIRKPLKYDAYAQKGMQQAEAHEVALHLRLEKQARFLVEDTFYPNQITQLNDGETEVRAEIPDGEWLYSWLLSFGGYVEVLSPPHVREKLAKQAKLLWEKNG